MYKFFSKNLSYTIDNPDLKRMTYKEYYEKNSMKNEISVLNRIDIIKNEISAKYKKESIEYVNSMISLIDKFKSNIKKLELFDLPSNGLWFYNIHFDVYSIKLLLQKFPQKIENNYIYPTTNFLLYEEKVKMITVDEYAKINELSDSSVRQLIRRGKLIGVRKKGSEWFISALSKVIKREKKEVIYYYTKIDVPSEYGFIGDYNYLKIKKNSKDKNQYDFVFIQSIDDEVIDKIKTLSIKEKEKIELLIIGSENVENDNEIIYYEDF